MTDYVSDCRTSNPPGGEFSAASRSAGPSTYFSMHLAPRNNCPSKTPPAGGAKLPPTTTKGFPPRPQGCVSAIICSALEDCV